MILYHFPHSPFARRVRLTLAHKGLVAELRDARADATFAAELRRLNPAHTVPVLVDGERVVVDSMAIAQYLERKFPSPPVFPEGDAGAETFELVALADVVATQLVDLALRYHDAHEAPGFAAVRTEQMARAQGCVDRLGDRVGGVPAGTPLFGAFGYADMALATLVFWHEGLAERAKTFPLSQRMIDLGLRMPPALTAWAAPFRPTVDAALTRT